MQVTETLNEGLKRRYSIAIPASVFGEKVDAKLAEVRTQIQIKGFRKGKVPLSLVKGRFGQQLLSEAMQETIDTATKKHFEDSGDRPALQPRIEMKNGNVWKEGDDLEFEVSYEALPEIPDVDMKTIGLERMTVNADEADVESELGRLAELSSSFEDRPRGSKAANGDRVVIDFIGKVDGKAFEDSSAEDYPLVLGSGSFFEGFEAQLVGAAAGNRVSVNVTVPDGHGDEHLRGKVVVFDCTVKAVQAPMPAGIDDKLAVGLGAENLDDLRVQIAKRMEAAYAVQSRLVMKRALLDALDKKVSFELPPSLVEQEARQIAHRLWHDEHPEVEPSDQREIEPDEEHNRLAERRVRLGLFLAKLGGKAGIEVSERELADAAIAYSRRYPGHEHEFLEIVQKNPTVRQQLRAPLFEDKVVDYVAELAEVAERVASKDELRKAVESLEEE